MRKICCDHCGEEIQSTRFRIVGEQEPQPFIVTITDPELRILTEQVAKMDFCESCFSNLMRLLADTEHKLLTATFVTDK